MSIPVSFLMFKLEWGLIDSTNGVPYQIMGTLADKVVCAISARKPSQGIPFSTTEITENYNYVVSKLQVSSFFMGIDVLNIHYADHYNVEDRLSMLRRYAPGTNVFTIDVECQENGIPIGSSGPYAYGYKLTELSTGDYMTSYGLMSGQHWFDKNGAYYGLQAHPLFIRHQFSNRVRPDFRSEIFVVDEINDDGTLPDDDGYDWNIRLTFDYSAYCIGYIHGLGDLFLGRINAWKHYALPPNTVPDPYDQIPSSSQAGGVSSPFDFSDSDDIDFPANPGVSAVNTGFISLWAPTPQQMLRLSSYMWNADALTIDFWKRLWADPLDIIYGLNIIPVDFRATGRNIIGGTESVVVGLVDTKVPMDYLVEQWIELDCGSINLAEAWGAYLDYDPYTKLEIYLPYCGIHPLKVDDFMSGTISLKYKIDLLSGACVALIKATKPNDDENNLDSVVYQFMGNCATQVPVTAAQYADAVRAVISLAGSIGSMVATGVAAAAGAGAGGLSKAGAARVAGSEISAGSAAVENVMSIKPGIERSGAIGSAAGLLGVQTPYLIITRPRQARPDEQNVYTGYPSFMTRTLGDLTGWTMVKAIHLEGIGCTADELSEIDNLLKEGVIF